MAIPILMYHSISNDKNDLSVSVENFEKQMKLMKNSGFETIYFNKLSNHKNKKKFIITFDDGYENLITNALPILKKYNFTSTCFFIPKYIGKFNIWDEDKPNFKKLNLMNFDQIKLWVNEGMSVGSHTLSHKNLMELNYKDKINEIIDPLSIFSNKLSIKIDCFSYPYGRFDNESLNIVKENYKFAVTTKRSRFKENKFNLYELPRVPINSNDNIFKFFVKINTIYEDLKFK